MKTTRSLVTLVTATLTAASAATAVAEDKFSFPSPNGVHVAATTPHFAPVATDPQANLTADVGGAAPVLAMSRSSNPPPLPIACEAYTGHFAGSSKGGDAYSYRFLTNALGAQSYSNYAADYYRIFALAYAVSAWTERVYGLVELGYGAVDGWTAGAYYLNKVRGPSGRRDAPPDLSTMPTFRAHPELETPPVFQKD